MSAGLMDVLTSDAGIMIACGASLLTILFLLVATPVCDWIERRNIARKMAKAFPRPPARAEVTGPVCGHRANRGQA